MSQQENKISDLRAQIDVLDEELIKLLAKRQAIVEKVIIVKKRDGMPARIPVRVDFVIQRARDLAQKHHLNPALAEALWTEMVEWFVNYEQNSLDQ